MTERKSSGIWDAPNSAVDEMTLDIAPSAAMLFSAECRGDGRDGLKTWVRINGVAGICGGTPSFFGGAAGAGATGIMSLEDVHTAEWNYIPGVGDAPRLSRS